MRFRSTPRAPRPAEKPIWTSVSAPTSSTVAIRKRMRTVPVAKVCTSVRVRSKSGRINRRRLRRRSRGNVSRSSLFLDDLSGRAIRLFSALGCAYGQVLAALFASSRDDQSTFLRAHSSAEPVLVGAFASAGLIRTFHWSERKTLWQ